MDDILIITEEKMEIFLTTLKSVIPDIEIALDHSDDIDEDNITKYKIGYKVYSIKYKTDYEKNTLSPNLYLDKTTYFEHTHQRKNNLKNISGAILE